MKKRKDPLRKCLGCQQQKNKKDLIRIVKDKDNNISVDFTGKKSGRGAYICPSVECLSKAIKNKGLDRSFKMKVSESIYEQLKKELDSKL